MTTRPISPTANHAKPTAASPTPPAAAPSKRRILGVQLVILFCILLTLASFGASYLAGRDKLTPVTLGLPVITVLAFLALSLCVARGHAKAFGFLMLISMCLYGAVMIVFSQGYIVTQVLGKSVPGWVYWVGLCVLILVHGWFATVVYEYAVELRGGGQQGSKQDMGVLV